MTLVCERIGSGADVVLLHGWGMNSGVWAPLLQDWRERFTLYLVDLPGHGNSPTLDTADRWVEACLDVAPMQAHWIGWSLGGQLALQAALTAPERVVGLSLIATTPCFVAGADWPCALKEAVFDDFSRALVTDPAGTLKRFLALQVRGAESARETLLALRHAVDQRPPAAGTGLRDGLALLRETDLRQSVSSIKCPQQWLLGARDTLIPHTLANWLDVALPSARAVCIDGAGHAPFLSHPASCLPLLESAIDG